MDLNLETTRLRLTPLSPEDVDLALEMFTDPDVIRYVGDLMTEDDIRANIPDEIKRGADGWIGIWCVSLRKTGEKLGSIFLLPMPIEDDDTDYSLVVPGQIPDAEIEIGYAFKKTAWGSGFATEACQRLVAFAFEETPLTRLLASFYDENAPSKAVLRKTGFADIGDMFCYGEMSPVYELTRAAWHRARSS